MKTMKFSLPLALVMALSLSAPAVAQQGKGKGQGNGRPQQTQVERRGDDDDDDREERRLERRRQEQRAGTVYRQDGSRRDGRRVPPGWCQGRGNPHNTVANCGTGSGRRRANGTYVDRYDPDYNRSGSYSRDGNYAQAHQEFHAWHDRECRRAAAERPLDLNHQVRVRTECKARHDEFHRQWGTAHR